MTGAVPARLFVALAAAAVVVGAAWWLGLARGSRDGSGAGAARDAVATRERPGVREVAPGRWEVVLHAYNWAFQPAEIRVPAGAEVTFRARSVEEVHGFAIEGTNVALALFPGEPSEATYVFSEPGEYPFACHLYCGAGHFTMAGKIVVE